MLRLFISALDILQPAVIILFYIVLTISAVRAYRYRKENNIPMKKFLWLVALGIIVGMIVPGILASVFVLNFLRQPNDGRYAASFGVKLAAYRDSAIFLFQAVQMERERHRPPAAKSQAQSPGPSWKVVYPYRGGFGGPLHLP